MGGQRETLIPPRFKYITFPLHQNNNSPFKSIIGFDAPIYNNTISYL